MSSQRAKLVAYMRLSQASARYELYDFLVLEDIAKTAMCLSMKALKVNMIYIEN